MSERQDTLWQYALVTQLSVPRATMVYTDEGSRSTQEVSAIGPRWSLFWTP
jgi:hypothetical protein